MKNFWRLTNLKMIIAKEFVFDAAHRLINHSGKCKNLHGHTYRLRVFVNGEVNNEGFVMDFSELNKVVKENVLNLLDHNYLNNIIENPTAENIVFWIWNQLKNCVSLYEIWLWETPTSLVIYRK